MGSDFRLGAWNPTILSTGKTRMSRPDHPRHASFFRLNHHPTYLLAPMGIPGVWEVSAFSLHFLLQFTRFQLVNPTGKARAFSELAVADGFEKNAGNKRGLRVGVDAYIWYVHSKGGEGGAHPELRTLFFKVIKFCELTSDHLFLHSS